MKRRDPEMLLREAGTDEQFLRKIWRPSREQWRRFALMALSAWAAYALLLSPGGAIHLARLQRTATALEGEIDRLVAARDSLDQALAAIGAGEPFLLESVAREEFGLARENERIYLLPPEVTDRARIDAARRYGSESFSERSTRLHPRRRGDARAPR